MKKLKKLGLVTILTAALLAGPMPGIKATQNKNTRTASQVLTLKQPLAYADDYINSIQVKNFQPPKEEDLIGKLQWPLDDFIITQKFGENKGNYYGPNGHAGIDLMSYFGADVKAAANGIIASKGSDECPNFEQPNCNYGWGNWIMLWHPDLKIHTVYSHLKEKPYKEINKRIWQGETIGHEGGSGFQFYVISGPEKPITGNPEAHHLDFMVGAFKIYENREGKTDYSAIKLYDPLKFLPQINK